MTRWTAGLVAAVLAAGPAAAQDAKPEDVIKKAIEAHGGADNLNKYPASVSTMTGKLNIGGAEIPISGTMKAQVPGKVKLDLTAELAGQKVSIQQVVNGNDVKQTENGKVSKLTDAQADELRQMGAAQEVSLLTPLLDPKKYALSVEKDSDVDGKPAAVVKVVGAGKGTKELRLMFDKGTGLLARMERKGMDPGMKAVTEATTFGGYKKIEGVNVPLTSSVTHDGKPFMTLTVTDYKPMEKLDDKEFVVTD